MRYLLKVSNHQFNWWLANSPKKGYFTARPKGRCRKQYHWSAHIVRGVSGLGEDASYRTVADLYLKYNSKAKQLTIYLSPSFTLSKVAKSERYKKSDESAYNTSKKFDPKTMKSCSCCLGTGKVDCPKCHGIGKVSKYVYNSTTHVNDSIQAACPMCMNGHESCIHCNGRGWNYK